jgi:hypothetical protein
MTYEPRRRPGAVLSERDLQAHRAALPHRAALQGTQANDAAWRTSEIKQVAEAYWAKHGKPEERAPEPKAQPSEPGPLMREAVAMAEALRKLRAGQVGQASAGEINHKLPRYVIGG